jgi:hypothetical protein
MARETVIRDDELDMEFVWHGGHTVNVFVQGREVDVFSFGDFAVDFGEYPEFVAAVDRYIADMTSETDE